MPLSIGLVGLGRWGANIKRTLEELGMQVVVIAKGDAIPKRLDGVCIATPSSTHAAAALPYIERGIPTFIEKPMATSGADARRIAEAAEGSGTPVFVGHIYLYNPAFEKVLDLLRTIGAIRRIDAEGNNDAPRADSSALWDWLPHHLSMGRELLGTEASQVSAIAEPAHGAYDAAVVTFMFGDIPLVSRICWAGDAKRRRVVVTGTKGTILLDETADKKVALMRDGSIEYPPYDGTAPLAAELRAFVEVVRTRTVDRPHVRDAIAIIRAIEAAERSLVSGSVVSVSV